MGINVALVDRARIVSSEAIGKKVEGTVIFDEASGDWFKCRLTLAAAPETQPPSYKGETSASTHATARAAEIMYALRDSGGEAVVLTAADRLEVDSVALGRALYEVQGDPEPIRKKRALLGWTVNTVLVDEHHYAEAR